MRDSGGIDDEAIFTRKSLSDIDSAAPTVLPEMSVSSHGIGLKIKPKSLKGVIFVQNVQDVAIETDDGGEREFKRLDIMKQKLPRRPARFTFRTLWALADGGRSPKWESFSWQMEQNFQRELE